MSVDVRERLDRLAHDAAPGVPPTDLWQRGVRRRRTRRAGSAVVALLAVLLVGGLAGLLVPVLPHAAIPTASTAAPGIPSRLVVPDPWTPGTDRLGAPGRLALVMGAERRSGLLGTSRAGVVGVSATTGSYRFLDLPGQLEDDTLSLGADATVALSPDGRSVAYWRGTDAVTGVAAYDAVSGRVRQRALPSRKGLAPRTLGWVDDRTLLLRYGVITQRSSSSMSTTLGPAVLWTPSDGTTTELDTPSDEDGFTDVVATAGGFSTWDGTTLGIWKAAGDPLYAGRRVTVRGIAEGATLGNLVLDPRGTRLAVVSGEGPSGLGRLRVGTIRPVDRSVTPRVVTPDAGGRRVEVQSVVGWRDADHVLVDGSVSFRWGVYAIDVRDGSVRRAVTAPQESWTPGRIFAADLLARPTVARPLPPAVVNPRAVALGGSGLVLVLLGGVVVLRRRRGLR